MSREKIILGLDIDGILYDYHDALYTYCQYELNYNGTYGEFWLDYIPNLSPSKCQTLVENPIPYDMLTPSKAVMDFLEYANANSEIFYITGRPIELDRITRRYLVRYGFPQKDNLYITKDKPTVCRYLGVTHFIDDFPSQVLPISKITNAYLMARIHNRNDREGLNVVSSLKEFKEIIFQ